MAGMQSGGITGSLVQRYWVDVPQLPGNASPKVHRDTGDHSDDTGDYREGGSTQAPAGGNYVADEVFQGQIPVLTGTPGAPNTSHVSSGSHRGQDGDGNESGTGDRGRPQDDLAQPLEHKRGGVHDPATLQTAGLGGAAFGGLRRTGTMDPSSNPGGVMLGHRYVPVAVRRRQNLHFNSPGLRAIRWPVRTTERDSPSPGGTHTSPFNPTARYSAGAGASWPRLRRILRPVGSSAADMDPIDQAPAAAPLLDAGPVGGEWVQ
jgi:hypothetical protein